VGWLQLQIQQSAQWVSMVRIRSTYNQVLPSQIREYIEVPTCNFV
jgi:hypothetical protein